MAFARGLIGAVDLGGTKIYSAVNDAVGKTVGDDLRSTEADEGRDGVIRRIVESMQAACSVAGAHLSDLSGIGVVAPGPIDAGTGHVLNAPNLPGWSNVPLAEILSRALGPAVVLENDGNAAALGEYVSGAGRGADGLIYVTISTGIGGGFVFKGELFRGVSGAAGEIGHMVIQPGGPRCGCGNQGCLESLASGTAIARAGTIAIAEGRAPLLKQIVDASGEPVSSAQIAQAAAEGDEAAGSIIRDAATTIGTAFGNLINLLNPDVIVVGGGVVQIGAPLLGPVENTMRSIAFPDPGSRVRLLTAELPYAGIAGVVELVRRQLPAGQQRMRMPH